MVIRLEDHKKRVDTFWGPNKILLNIKSPQYTVSTLKDDKTQVFLL